jgi:hypothetical protein
MNEVRHDAWFYTRDLEKIGPVTFADLRIKAQEGGLNPRLDMVWTHGMEAWKPSGEVEGLFERRTEAAATPAVETTTSAATPYAPPAQSPAVAGMGPDAPWPGARRSLYIIMVMIFPILWNIAFKAGAGFLTAQFGPEIMSIVAILVGVVPLILVIHFSLARFVNLGMSRWWFLGNFVPLLNFWIGYRLFACPAGYAAHKKLDGAGIALAIIYWLFVLLIIGLLVAIIVLFFGLAGSPEFQEKLREIIENAQKNAARS